MIVWQPHDNELGEALRFLEFLQILDESSGAKNVRNAEIESDRIGNNVGPHSFDIGRAPY